MASTQLLQHTNAALTITSQPVANEAKLAMPWAKRHFVDAKQSSYTMGVDRTLVDAVRSGSYARAEGQRHVRVKSGEVTLVTGKTVECSPAESIDYTKIARAQDPFRPKVTAARLVTKLALTERYDKVVTLITDTSEWDAGASVALAALGVGASGVQLSDPSSLPFVDLDIAARQCAKRNGGAWPHAVIFNDIAAGYMRARGARTSLSVTKEIRELTEDELVEKLAAHLKMEVHVESAMEGATTLFPNVIVFVYYPTEIVPTEQGFDVPPSTFVLVHEKVPSLGVNGELVIKVTENDEKTGILIAAVTFFKAQKVDNKAIQILTAAY